MTAIELSERTGIDRQTLGRLLRGDIQTIPSPEQIRLLVRELPITAEQIVVACGYDFALTPHRKVPDELAQAWTEMSEDSRHLVLGVARRAANSDRQEREQGEQ